ncbi:MAG: sulfate reduction electron transfer complex DsrMKJOP subunit DsrO [Desulfatibacillaceae bacterium]
MDSTRRHFLKIAGVAAVGATASPAFANLLLENFPAPRGAARSDEALGQEDLSKSRWAMVVDLTKLNARVVQAAQEACHSVHNVPDFQALPDSEMSPGEKTRSEIKWIWPTGYENAFPNQMNQLPRKQDAHDQGFITGDITQVQPLVLCNHCEHPPCVRVCPTKATFQRDDGIVLMDFHRCIGCRFCMAACPYGARSFNWYEPVEADRKVLKGGGKVNPDFPTRTKGVVEKCNFCAERLSKGQLPACVEACENEELLFGDMNDRESVVRKVLRERFAIRRKASLGTQPQVYYLI